jgi:hypothetical protein
MIELLFALGAAEVIRLSSVLSVSSGSSCFYLHAANGIFYRSDAAHMDLLGLVKLSDYGSAIELRLSAGHSPVASRLENFVSLANSSNRYHLTLETKKSGRYCSGRRIARCSNAWDESACQQRFIV